MAVLLKGLNSPDFLIIHTHWSLCRSPVFRVHLIYLNQPGPHIVRRILLSTWSDVKNNNNPLFVPTTTPSSQRGGHTNKRTTAIDRKNRGNGAANQNETCSYCAKLWRRTKDLLEGHAWHGRMNDLFHTSRYYYQLYMTSRTRESFFINKPAMSYELILLLVLSCATAAPKEESLDISQHTSRSFESP